MMLRSVIVRTLAAAAIVSLVGVSMAAAPAFSAGPAVILIVDTESVFAQSKVGQSIRTQFQEQAKKLQAEGAKTEAALQADAKKLSDERALLSQEDLQKNSRHFSSAKWNSSNRCRKRAKHCSLASSRRMPRLRLHCAQFFPM